jgi:DNA polymerase-3 subunit epsilon
MKFNRPIVFFDIETTGTNIEEDKIIEIYMLKIGAAKTSIGYRLNPGILMPEGATAVHGISNADIEGYPTFADVAQEIFDFIQGCDLAGYNSIKFDVPMLYFELQRCGYSLDYKNIRLFDVYEIFKQMEPRTLSGAVKFYLNRSHDGAHGAKADVAATLEVFLKQMAMYDNLPCNADDLALFCNNGKKILDISGKFAYNDDNEIVFTFGKNKDKLIKDNIDYLHWMLTSNFNSDVKKFIVEFLKTGGKTDN